MAGRFSVEAVFKAIDKVTAPVSRMQNRIGKFTRGMERGFRSVNRVVGKVSRGVITSLKRVGATAGVVLTGLGFALRGVANDADELAKAGRRLDMPVEELQEWRFVASQSGVDQKLFNSSLGAFTKRLGEARAGIGPLVSGLKKSNPALLAQLKQTDSVSEALEIYVQAMRDAPTAIDRAALANAAFSRAGLKLANISDNSTEAIRRLRAEMRENGVITQKQAEQAEAYNDAMDSLGRALTGFKQSVLLPLLPQLTEVARRFREWSIANREVISERVLQFLKDLQDNFSLIVTWLKRIGIAIGVLFAFNAALKTIIGVMTVVNLVMAANPISLIVIGVMALIGAFAALIVWFEEIYSWFDGLSKVAKIFLGPITLIMEAIKFIRDNWSSITGAVSKIGEFFGFGGDDEEDAANGGSTDAGAAAQGQTADNAGSSQVISPQDRVAKMIEERRQTSRSEVTIKDETGRAAVTGGKLGADLALQSAGAF